MTIKEIESRGAYKKILGHDIFYLDKGKGDSVIVVLHGYPTCSHDYNDVIDYLGKDKRIVIHDHLGFGLSDKPVDNEYLLSYQADIAIALWKELGFDNVHIIAHDYGTSVATEMVARHNVGNLPIKISSLTLCNGSMLIDMSQLRPIQKLLKSKFWGPIIAKLSNRNTFHRNMRNLWSDASKYKKAENEVLWLLLRRNGGKKVLPKITGYINQRFEHYDRWVGSLKEMTIPTHILWAEDDPVAVVAMADKLKEFIPHAKKTILGNSGHYPMIETPIIWANEVLAFLDELA